MKCHMGRGVRKVPKKCHVLFEWPIKSEINYNFSECDVINGRSPYLLPYFWSDGAMNRRQSALLRTLSEGVDEAVDEEGEEAAQSSLNTIRH